MDEPLPREYLSTLRASVFDPTQLSSGKTLGGSSSINGAAWTRGLDAQYDAIGDLLEPSEANLQWNWQNLFGYMKKVCDSLRLLPRFVVTERTTRFPPG